MLRPVTKRSGHDDTTATPHPRERTPISATDARPSIRGSAGTGWPSPKWVDLLAGLSVAFVLIPQSLAYAELAGLSAVHGLYAAAVSTLAAAFFASSPFLQTGPTVLTSILTFGVLATVVEPGSGAYVAAAAMLALVVGVTRLAIGLLRLGGIAYAMSRPVLMGFTSAMAVVILAGQIPAAFGVVTSGHEIGAALIRTALHPGAWNGFAIGLTVVTLVLMLGGRLLSPVFPGVLIAVVVGIAATHFLGYGGPLVGALPTGLPPFSLELPWGLLPHLLVGGAVIAVVGFAEVASIARTFAALDHTLNRSRWDPNREFIGQGVANLASGLFSGFPVGGSFSRSSLNRTVGARTRWSGAVAGIVTLAVLPFAFLLAEVPKAVLAAIVIGAVIKLLQIRPLLRLWRASRPQFLVSWATFLLTLALTPRIDYAVVIGIALALAVHLWRESRLGIAYQREGDTLTVVLTGVLWFMSAPQLEDSLENRLRSEVGISRLRLDGHGLGRVDLSGVMLLRQVIESAAEMRCGVEFEGFPKRTTDMLERLRSGGP